MIRTAVDICATVALLLQLFVMERPQLIWSKVLLSALDRDNYQSLKLAELAMKILERIVDGFIRKMVSIDDSQFGFGPRRGTLYCKCNLCDQEVAGENLAMTKQLYMTFVVLEKTFDHVP